MYTSMELSIVHNHVNDKTIYRLNTTDNAFFATPEDWLGSPGWKVVDILKRTVSTMITLALAYINSKAHATIIRSHNHTALFPFDVGLTEKKKN